MGKTEGDRPSPQGSSESVPILEEADLSALMPHEKDGLAYGNTGPPANQIADRLGATRKTRANHRHRIYFKLGVQSQSHAMYVAFHRGILDNEYAPHPSILARPAFERVTSFVRVVIGDRNQLVREFLSHACSERGMQVVAEVSTVAESLVAASLL